MKASKSILVSLLVIASVSAQAQSDRSDFDSNELSAPMTTAPRAQGWNQEGVQVSLNMSNFSGANSFQNMSYSSDFSSGTSTQTSSIGMGMETYALEAGYNVLPAHGFGWYAGGFVRKSLQSGTETTEVGFVGARGNAQYAFNKYFYCYIGANVTHLYEVAKSDSSQGTYTYQPNMSGQTGFGFRVNKGLSLYAGYENDSIIEKYTNNPGFANFNINSTGYLYFDGVTTGLAWTL